MNIIKPIPITNVEFISSNVPENDHPVWNAATTYALNDLRIVITGGYHNIYRSLQGTNLNHNPTVEIQGDPLNPPVWWLLVSATNRWKMLDERVDTQTTNANLIDVTYSIAGRIGGISLQNIEGTEVEVTAYNNFVSYNKKINLSSYGQIPSYDEYYYGRREYAQKIMVNDLPPSAGLTVNIKIKNQGGVAKCGLLVTGYLEEFEIPKYGLSLESVDYTSVIRNFDGTVKITKRGFSVVMDVELWVPKAKTASVSRFLNANNSTPMAYIGSQDYEITNIYGMHTSHRISIETPTYDLLTFKIEGLI